MKTVIVSIIHKSLSHYSVEVNDDAANDIAIEKARSAFRNGEPEVFLGNESDDIEEIYVQE